MALNSSVVTANDAITDDVYNSMRKDIIERAGEYGVSGGAANVQTLTVDAQITSGAYVTGQVVRFKAGFDNTGAVTINVNSLGAKTIKDNGNDLLQGELKKDFHYVLEYDGTNFEILNKRDAVGTIDMYIGTAAPHGWLLLQGGTIGNAASGGTARAKADTESLFTLLWNSLADGQAPVSSGRGASASADFAANKTITLPDMQGNVPVGKDGGTFSTLGNTGGSETHTLVLSETPAHTHDLFLPNGASAGFGLEGVRDGGSDGPHTTDSKGGNGAHNNLQPWFSINFKIKY